METVAHLWNVNQVVSKLKCSLAAELQTFYMQKCKNLKNEVELPKRNFGPSVMCSHCGSLWNTMNYQARVLHGRKMSKSMRKIAQNINKNDRNLSKACVSLARRCIKNEMNKLVMKCSICSKKTKLPLKKKSRPKPAQVKLDDSQTETPQNNRKKKKKKSRDKTAGLNISGCAPESPLNIQANNKAPAKPLASTPKINNKRKIATSTKKYKMLNIERLKHIVKDANRDATPTKNKSLRSFLSQLY